MGAAALLRVTETLISIGVAIQALETLSARHIFSPVGLYDWNLLSTNVTWMRQGIRGALLNVLFQYPGFLILILLQLVGALAILSGQFPEQTFAAITAMLIVHMLFLLRNQYGLDGSDQMMLLVLTALFVYHLHPTNSMLTIVFGFLTGQLLLSYLTSGIAKAVSPMWRSGDAITGILSTNSYGSRILSRFFLKNHWAARMACWGVFCYECCGPLLVWVHPSAALAFIVIGTVLHLSISACMGLNIFFWSFTSTYPALYFFSQKFSWLGFHG
jgi:hypothetical protein